MTFRHDSPYFTLSGLIVEFLHEHGLAEQYVESLKPEQACIGCGRDGGDHDMECIADMKREDYFYCYRAGDHSSTNSPYEDQIEGLLKFYIKHAP